MSIFHNTTEPLLFANLTNQKYALKPYALRSPVQGVPGRKDKAQAGRYAIIGFREKEKIITGQKKARRP